MADLREEVTATMKIKMFLVLIFLVSVNLTYAQQNLTDKKIKLRDMNLHIIPQAHIDLAWWWRYDPWI
jgi:hypothetical protein